MAAYDPDNIFAKIIDGKIPCFKVFESKSSLAYLDAFPMVEGHTLIVPKAKGATSLLEMPPKEAAEYLRDLQRVAKAVKEATGADGVNIWQNCGEASGQTVFHPHTHIIPRKAGDGLFTYPASAKEMLSKDAASPLVDKIGGLLAPKPLPLKKAIFKKVSSVKPDSKGVNLKLKLVESPKEVDGKQTFFEALAGDASGSIVLSMRDTQKEGLSAGDTVTIQNGAARMVKGHIRMTVDKWGKLEKAEEALDEEINSDEKKNVSATEYELVGQ